MTYEEAIEKMGKAFEDKAEYSAYELVNEKECIRAAAEAIGLREMMEALKTIHDTFAADLAQGYRTKDKEFAVIITARALSPAP
jgi:hypothetical protein